MYGFVSSRDYGFTLRFIYIFLLTLIISGFASFVYSILNREYSFSYLFNMIRWALGQLNIK